jgi:hypothetical protein
MHKLPLNVMGSDLHLNYPLSSGETLLGNTADLECRWNFDLSLCKTLAAVTQAAGTGCDA